MKVGPQKRTSEENHSVRIRTPGGESARKSSRCGNLFAKKVAQNSALKASLVGEDSVLREGINFGGTWNGRTFDIKGFDSDEAVEIPLGNTGELSGQCANGIP